ncbi:MAG: transglutaminase domain-containing protein [Chloroflexi bacterium]|nr:transglutaminase domain-containing protein [Chloroflexota bacterium]
MVSDTPQTYYAAPGLMTDPGEYTAHFDRLPPDLPSLVKIVQGLMVHIFWAERYGLTLTEERKQEVNLRPVAKKLKRLLELDDRPLTEERPLDRRLVGNCRDFSVLLCAMLRHQGVPVRARAGFGAYFLPDHYEDHWVCEIWDTQLARWFLVDAQLDAFQQQALGIGFDTFDVPRDQFITGGKAWLIARREGADPARFGIFDMHGLAFIRGNVVRDFLALNKVEILPWDDWDWIAGSDQEAAADAEQIDRLADLLLAGDAVFPDVRALYENDNRLRVPPGWQP